MGGSCDTDGLCGSGLCCMKNVHAHGNICGHCTGEDSPVGDILDS